MNLVFLIYAITLTTYQESCLFKYPESWLVCQNLMLFSNFTSIIRHRFTFTLTQYHIYKWYSTRKIAWWDLNPLGIDCNMKSGCCITEWSQFAKITTEWLFGNIIAVQPMWNYYKIIGKGKLFQVNTFWRKIKISLE